MRGHHHQTDDIAAGTEEDARRWPDHDYWRSLCPHLTITADGVGADAPSVASEREESAGGVATTTAKTATRLGNDPRARLVEDGYALFRDDETCGDREAPRDALAKPPSSHSTSVRIRTVLAEGMAHLRTLNIPATFILLFDETWELASESRELMGGAVHPRNQFNFDVLAWHVDPRSGESGFAPHRDRQPESVAGSFHDDGQAKYVTHWLALRDATPENSCLYVIPKQYDPGYLEGDDDGDDDDADADERCDGATHQSKPRATDPLSRALPTKESYQNIRATPRRGGQSLAFTHRIMHWGSRGNPNCPSIEPRAAVSFVYSDPAFEEPYVSSAHFSSRSRAPPFHIRLLLVCAQLLIYHERFELSAASVRACYDRCKKGADDLSEAYRKKVFVEFVRAMKDLGGAGGGSKSAKNASAGCDAEAVDRAGTENGDCCQRVANNDGNRAESIAEQNDHDSDDEDAILEEMLNHQEEFDDDYDELSNEERSNDGYASRDEEEEEEDESLFRKRKGSDFETGCGDKKRRQPEADCNADASVTSTK